MISAAGNVAAR